MFIIAINHGLSRTGQSYLAEASGEVTKFVDQWGKECGMGPHGDTGVLEVEEATRYATKEEAYLVSDNLLSAETPEEIEANNGRFTVLKRVDAIAHRNRLLSKNGVFHKPSRTSEAIRQLMSPNQVSVLLDLDDTMFVYKGVALEERELALGRLGLQLKNHKNFNLLVGQLEFTLGAHVPTAMSSSDRRNRLIEDLAMIYQILIQGKHYDALAPFIAEQVVVPGKDVTIASEPTPENFDLNIVTTKVEVLEDIAKWFVDNRDCVELKPHDIQMQKSILEYFGYLQMVSTSFGVDLLNPVEITIYSDNPVYMDLAAYVLKSMGVKDEMYSHASNFKEAYRLCDVFISAKSVCFSNKRMNPIEVSMFHPWHALMLNDTMAAQSE